MSGFRFAHVGVVLCLGAAVVTSVQLVDADAPAGVASAFVPITPCRLADTRPASLVGGRAAPVGAQEIVQFAVWGSNGNCTIPSTATGIATNVTTVNPNASSYLTVFPADAVQPLTSNLNWTPASPPTPNQVTVGLSATGAVKVFNNAGTIDVIIDIVGYYVASTSGPAGATGPAGPQGPAGADGTNGTNGTNGVTPAHIVWVATAGGDFTNIDAALASITTNSSSNRFLISVAPGVYTIANTVVLKDYVDIEGSGEDSTVITCACGTNTSPVVSGSSATLRAENNINAEVRNITIDNTGLNQYATAIWTGGTGAGTVRFTQVTANASGNASLLTAAIYINGNRTSLTDVTASASTSVAAPGVSGVFVSGAGPVSMNNVVASGAGATANTIGVLFNSSLGGSVQGVHATATGVGGTASGLTLASTSNVSINDSIMSASNNGVGTASVGLQSAGPSPAGVNRITNSTGTGMAGASGYAVGMYLTNGSSAVLTDITATGVGGLDAFGLVVQDTSDAVVISATAAASGAPTTNTGTLLRNGSPSVSNLKTSATGAGSADATGLDFIVTGSPTLRNVDARATGLANVFGIRMNASGTLTGNSMTATATGGSVAAGVNVAAGSVNLANLTAAGGAGTGLYTPGAVAVVVRNSYMSGTADSVNRVSGTMSISNSHLSKPALNVLAGSCINVIDDSDSSINTDCT